MKPDEKLLWAIAALGWLGAAIFAVMGGYHKYQYLDLRESMDLCKAGNYRLSEERERMRERAELAERWARMLAAYEEEVTRQAP